MQTFAEKVISFNKNLRLDIELPKDIRVMNPFTENPGALAVSSAFYRKYYDDHKKRHLILGINPGRFGAGVTGVPFTDTKRLGEKCGLKIKNLSTHEPSSVFVYEVIDAYGGVERFFSDFYINSPSPLGFVKTNSKGKQVNFNYYDSKTLLDKIEKFLVNSICAHIDKGINTNVCFCMGSGKNFTVISRINKKHDLFKTIIPLEHPRYIMQYKSKHKRHYRDKYLLSFNSV